MCARTAGERGLGLCAEASHQAAEILGRSPPMLVPAGLFVMQQVPRACRGYGQVLDVS